MIELYARMGSGDARRRFGVRNSAVVDSRSKNRIG